MTFYHLDEIATINYQGYEIHTVVHSSSTANYKGMQRNNTATSDHNDKMVNKEIGDEGDNYKINPR